MTTETNFTPGPWVATSDNTVYQGYFIRSDSKPGYIAEIRAFTTQDEVDANKSLIAAAPELYAALEDLRDWYVEHTGMPATAANAALAKAYADARVREALLEAYGSMQDLHMSLLNDATPYVHPAQVASFAANRISALIPKEDI